MYTSPVMRVAIVAILVVGFAAIGVSNAGDKEVADEIMKIVKAEWAAMNQKNFTEAAKNWADDFTQFNDAFATRLEGKASALTMEQSWVKGGGENLFAEMLNPKVQVYGDVAILSYNYAGIDMSKDGKVEPGRAKSTRVYVKQNGKWMLVHANFAPEPLPK